MPSHTFSKDYLPISTPPQRPRPPPDTTTRRVLPFQGVRYMPQKRMSGSSIPKKVPHHDTSRSSSDQSTNSVNTRATGHDSLKTGRSISVPAWWMVGDHAPATVASTASPMEPAQLSMMKTRTQPTIPTRKEQVSTNKSPTPATKTQRAERRVVFSDTTEIAEFPVPTGHNLRPTGELAALKAAAKTDKDVPKLKNRSTSHLRTLKQEAAERAQGAASQLAAKERERRKRRELQRTISGNEGAGQAKTPHREPMHSDLGLASTMLATPLSGSSSLEFESERRTDRHMAGSQKVLICVTEGPSLREIREMRQTQRTVVTEERAQQQDVRDFCQSLTRDSLATRSLKRVLLRSSVVP